MTKAKIVGCNLVIQRGSTGWVAAFCPFSVGEKRCGEWCPHFGEPNHFMEPATLTICQMTKFAIVEE